jgi:endonuclease-3
MPVRAKKQTLKRKPAAKKKAPRRAARRATPEIAAEYYGRLRTAYPHAHCALDHRNAYELLVATILSAQCTDVRVNMVTPALFAKYPTPADLAAADPTELEEIVRSTGFFRSKAKNLIGMAQAVEERYSGKIPTELDDFVTLPGVGRKTGNVVRSAWYGLPGLPVDTHVTRLSHRLKLTNEDDPVKIEHDLGAIVPPDEWGNLSLRLIEHGRRVCHARKPRCDQCVLAGICPSAFKF